MAPSLTPFYTQWSNLQDSLLFTALQSMQRGLCYRKAVFLSASMSVCLLNA